MSDDSLDLKPHAISWSKIPVHLFGLKKYDGISASDVLLAISMFDFCCQDKKTWYSFPEFEIGYPDLAKRSFLSVRQVQVGIEHLVELGVILCEFRAPRKNKYTWRISFLQNGTTRQDIAADNLDIFAWSDVQSLHGQHAKLACLTVQEMPGLYIEFTLDTLSRLYRDYFSSASTIKIRVPARKSGTKRSDPQGSGSVVELSRRAAWEEAILYCATLKRSSWVRVYLTMVSGFNIDKVTHPKAYLKKLMWDESRQYESRKKSWLCSQGLLDNDDTFLRFIILKKEGRDGYPSEVY